jgi:ethanolamine utilization protein EutQ
MSTSSNVVRVMPFDAEFTAENGPVKVDRRTKPSGLTELSAGFVTFPEGGATDPWTLPYEEVFYVIEGELTLHLEGRPIVAGAGEVVTLEKGVTVVYEGTPGTRAFFSLVPANWLETLNE